jgi:Domain of unknown function (DUF4340)
MRWQTTAVIALLFLAVAGFFFYDVRYLEPGREKVEAGKNRLWAVEPKDVEEVTLKRPEDVVRLKRTDDGWQMLAPVEARAAAGTVNDLVTTVATAKMDREVAASPTSLADFGLEKPAAEVTLQVKGKTEPLRLALGSKSPTGVWVYARKDDSSGVAVVSETLVRDATKPVSDFRDRTVLAFDRKDVTGIEIVTRDDTIHAAAEEGGKWRITQPVSLPADTETVSDFLDKLQAAKVKEFVAEAPPALTRYGLDRPARVTIQTGKDKDRATKQLLLGRVDAEKKGVYAMRPGERSVLLLPEDVWGHVPKNVAVLRDKTVVAFDRDKLGRIDLESAKGAVTLSREGDQWKITAPEALPADSAAVGSLLFALREMKAQGFLGQPKITPTVRVSLWESGAETPKAVVGLAPSPEKRGGQPSAYAMVAGQEVTLVDGKLVDQLAKSVTDLRDRTVVSLDPKTVGRLRVKSGDQVVVLERSGDTSWKIIEPQRGSANGARVEDLLRTIRALRWTAIASQDGSAASEYGLEAPSLEVTLFKADGAEIGGLAVGKREGDRAYIRTKATPTVYAVDTRQLGEAPKIPDDFKG